METEKLLDLCKSLAKKYKSREHYEDLVNEGLVASYELISTGVVDEDKIASRARRAMYDYFNFRLKPIYVPPSHMARKAQKALYRGDSDVLPSGVAKDTYTALLDAIGGQTATLGDNDAVTQDHAIDYEVKEYYEHIVGVAEKTLTEEEFELFKIRYVDGFTQDLASEILNTTKSWASRAEKTILVKLRQRLVTEL